MNPPGALQSGHALRRLRRCDPRGGFLATPTASRYSPIVMHAGRARRDHSSHFPLLVSVLVILSVFVVGLSSLESVFTAGGHELGHGYCQAHGVAAVLVSSVSLLVAAPVQLTRPSDVSKRFSPVPRFIFVPPRV